jgi:putative SOS response-associated peptidase YedK
MCGRYMLTSPVEALRQLFMFEQRPNLMPRYNIAPTQDVPIVRLTRDGMARELLTVRWGLVPFWADDRSIGNRLINARCETVHTARAFREAYSRRRCLVPADGFFEWQKQGRLRQPFLIRRKTRRRSLSRGCGSAGVNRARMTRWCGPARSSPARPTI